MNRWARLHILGILLEQIKRATITRRLQQVHRLRFPCMGLASFAGLVEPADRQNVLSFQPARRVHLQSRTLNTRDPDAGNPAVHPGEELGNHGAGKPHSLEVQAAAIGRNHGNPHLRHDLQQALIDRLAVPHFGFVQRAIQQPAFNPVRQRVQRQIGVHSRCSGANQNGKIMRIDTFSGTHVQRSKRPKAFLHQTAMHRGRRQNHRNCHALCALMCIRQHNMRCSSANGLFDLGLNPVQPILQTLRVINRKRTVNCCRTIAEILHHRPETPVRNKRAI